MVSTPTTMKRALLSGTTAPPLRSIWFAVSVSLLSAQDSRTIKQDLMKLYIGEHYELRSRQQHFHLRQAV